jgi:DNA-directed RNA polymerase specialized sigma24 family protein
VTAAEEFAEFATGAAPRLRRTAFLLCGNWHTPEDLTQTTLAKMFVSWRRITRQDAVYAYVNRTLVNTYLADRRGKRARELLLGWLPERPVELPTPELRIVVLDALATLPPKAWGRGGDALLGRPERGPDRGPARMLAGQREEPERPGTGQAPGRAR